MSKGAPRITLRLPIGTKVLLLAEAKARGMSVSDLVRGLIEAVAK